MKRAKAPPSLPPAPVRGAFQRDLLRWYGRHRRSFPWRTDRSPYRVWISEIMLQQTRGDQAEPYYRRFLRRFPSLAALAAASPQEVLKAWEGLGYYARARNLHRAARLIRRNGGRFPGTVEGLRALPGVGDYTAAAIGSLAFNLPAAVVDGNVIRVLARVMAFTGDPRSTRARKLFRDWAQALLRPDHPGASNEAIMELGALCCTPRKPGCPTCPLRRVCRAYAGGMPEAYPARRAKKKLPHKVVGAAVIVRADGRILIARRRDTSMLGGLWEFPGGGRDPGETIEQCIARELEEEMGLTLRVGPLLTIVHHAYSHFTIELHAHWARIRRGRPRALLCADFAWVRPGGFSRYPFSRADLDIIAAMKHTALPEF